MIFGTCSVFGNHYPYSQGYTCRTKPCSSTAAMLGNDCNKETNLVEYQPLVPGPFVARLAIWLSKLMWGGRLQALQRMAVESAKLHHGKHQQLKVRVGMIA